MSPSDQKPKLVDANTLLLKVFDANSRPSLRWLREQQKRRAVPFIKVGRRVFFEPEKVRLYLAQTFTVEARQ